MNIGSTPFSFQTNIILAIWVERKAHNWTIMQYNNNRICKQWAKTSSGNVTEPVKFNCAECLLFAILCQKKLQHESVSICFPNLNYSPNFKSQMFLKVQRTQELKCCCLNNFLTSTTNYRQNISNNWLNNSVCCQTVQTPSTCHLDEIFKTINSTLV